MLHGTKEREEETGSGGEGGIRVRMGSLMEDREGKKYLDKSEFIKLLMPSSVPPPLLTYFGSRAPLNPGPAIKGAQYSGHVE